MEKRKYWKIQTNHMLLFISLSSDSVQFGQHESSAFTLMELIWGLPASESGCWLSNPLCTPAALPRGSCWLHSKPLLIVTHNSAWTSPRTWGGESFCTLHLQWEYLNKRNLNGLCLNCWIYILCMCGGNSGLRQGGWIQMEQTEDEGWTHSM